MRKGNKSYIKIILSVAFIGIMFFILYRMFHDSYDDIIDSLAKTNIKILCIMLILGNLYYITDAVIYHIITVKQGYKISFIKSLSVAYMSIFFNVISFGAGIKPGQIYYLHKQGVNTGTACSITMMPYIFHKTVIVIYALVLLFINNFFVISNFESSFGYIYAGVGLSLLIIIFMILLCAANWFHSLVCKILDHTLGKTRFKDSNEKIKEQITLLREATIKIIKKPSAWISLCFVEILKMSFWYVIPAISLYALGEGLGGVSFSQALTITALMQLLMGVIPTSGGVGSLEVVFSLLFAAIFGKVIAGSSMVLYRISTYYFPFLISLILMAFAGNDLHRIKKTSAIKDMKLDYENLK